MREKRREGETAGPVRGAGRGKARAGRVNEAAWCRTFFLDRLDVQVQPQGEPLKRPAVRQLFAGRDTHRGRITPKHGGRAAGAHGG